MRTTFCRRNISVVANKGGRFAEEQFVPVPINTEEQYSSSSTFIKKGHVNPRADLSSHLLFVSS